MNSTEIVKATFWSSIQRFGGLLVSFISNIVLARLLSPNDFGILGLVMVFIGIADVLVEGGLGNALIQKKELTSKDNSTVFSVNLIFSILLFSIIFLIAPLVEDYTQVDGLTIYLRAQAICIIVRAFYVVNYSQMVRGLLFKRMAMIVLISQLLSTTIGIIMALQGMGVWSLLVKTIILDLSCSILYAFYSPFRYRLTFDNQIFKSLFSFGFPIAIANVLESVYSNITSFVIGKRYSVKDLGYYNQAFSLEQIPVYSVSAIINQVFFPVFSKLQEDECAIKEKYQNTIRIISFFVYPILTFLIVFAKPIITIMYTAKWVGCVPIFQVLCITGFFNTIYHLSRSTLKAIGKSKVLLYTQIASVIIGLILILIGIRYQMTEFVYFLVLYSVISYIIIGYYVGVYINYSVLKQIKDFIFTLIISMISGFVCYIITQKCQLPIVLNVILSMVVYAVLYISIHHVLKTKPYRVVLEFIKTKRK